jgi:DNA-binding NarL/FixJ family response regulator
LEFADRTELDQMASTGGRFRTLIVGDNAHFIAAMSTCLSRFPRFEVIGHARSGWDALRLAAELLPRLVLVDFKMRDMTGAAVARALKARARPPRVIVMSHHDSKDYMDISLKAGADGYVLKADMERVPDLVRTIEVGHPRI